MMERSERSRWAKCALWRTVIPENGDIRGLLREARRVEASPCGNAEMGSAIV